MPAVASSLGARPQSDSVYDTLALGRMERRLARGSPPTKDTACPFRNAREDPEWAEVERRMLSIAGRAISTMIHSSGANDLMRIYFVTQRDGVAYNLAYIGGDFSAPRTGDFGKAYMNALFDYAYQQARHGYPWKKVPPRWRAIIGDCSERIILRHRRRRDVQMGGRPNMRAARSGKRLRHKIVAPQLKGMKSSQPPRFGGCATGLWYRSVVQDIGRQSVWR